MSVFLDKATGSPSMVRLVAFILTLDASVVTAAICYVAIQPTASVALVTALTGTLTALVASGVVALFKRTPAASQPAAKDESPAEVVGFKVDA